MRRGPMPANSACQLAITPDWSFDSRRHWGDRSCVIVRSLPPASDRPDTPCQARQRASNVRATKAAVVPAIGISNLYARTRDALRGSDGGQGAQRLIAAAHGPDAPNTPARP